MIELKSEPAELRMTIHVTRKETGKVDTYELIGTPVKEEKAEDENGSNS
jgi:hypothetical protein